MGVHINYVPPPVVSAPPEMDSSSFIVARPDTPANDNTLDACASIIDPQDCKRLWFNTVELSLAPSNHQIIGLPVVEAPQVWRGKIIAIAYTSAVSVALLAWCYLLGRTLLAGIDWVTR